MNFEIIKNLFTDEEMVEALTSKPEFLKRTLEANSREIWEYLSESSNDDVRAAVAIYPDCPEDILRKLSKDKSDEVRANVAANPNCPEDLLRELAKEEFSKVPDFVAENSKSPGDLLRELIERADGTDYILTWTIRCALSNPNCPEDLLWKYGEKYPDCFDIICGITLNPKCPEKLLRQIAETSKNLDILCLIAECPKCPEDLLEKWVHYENTEFGYQAYKNLRKRKQKKGEIK